MAVRGGNDVATVDERAAAEVRVASVTLNGEKTLHGVIVLIFGV